MNQHKHNGRAFFAVKRKASPSDDVQLAPQLISIVETYDDGIRLAERRNVYADGDPYYVAPFAC